MALGNRQFAGLYPRMAPRLLPENAAQVALNVWLERGQLDPVPALVDVAGVGSFVANVRTIYRFDDNRWFQWPMDVDVVRAPIREDTVNRTIWTGDDYPRQTSEAIMRGGGFSSPGLPISRRLGVPAPESAPDVTLGMIANQDNDLVAETHAWVYTLLSDLDEEGPPSPPSRNLTREFNAAADAAQASVRLYSDAGRTSGIQVTLATGRTLDGMERDGGAGNGLTLRVRAGSTNGLNTSASPIQLTYSTDQVGGGGSATTTLGALFGVFDVDPNFTVSYFGTGASADVIGGFAPHQLVGVANTGDMGFEDATFAGGSDQIDADAIQPVTITTDTTPPASFTGGAAGINRKRIYRTATGSDGETTFFLLATLPITTASYTDETLTADLGAEIVSTFWDPPPADLTGLIALPNGVLAGFVDRDVYFSEPYQPHAWPRDYVQPVDFPVVGLGNFGLNVVVGTQGRPYLISGSHPAEVSVSRMEFTQRCASKRSFAFIDRQGVAFASPEGLILVGPNGGERVTRELYERAQWQALDPESFEAVYHDGAYVAFQIGSGTGRKAIALNAEMNGAVEIEDSVKTVYHDEERDAIYVIEGTTLREWRTDADSADPRRTMRWRSKLHVGRARTYSAAEVIADAYPVTFRLFTDGIEVSPGHAYQTVTSNVPFRLPGSMGSHTDWEFEVEGTSTVKEVHLGGMKDLFGG